MHYFSSMVALWFSLSSHSKNVVGLNPTGQTMAFLCKEYVLCVCVGVLRYSSEMELVLSATLWLLTATNSKNGSKVSVLYKFNTFSLTPFNMTVSL